MKMVVMDKMMKMIMEKMMKKKRMMVMMTMEKRKMTKMMMEKISMRMKMRKMMMVKVVKMVMMVMMVKMMRMKVKAMVRVTINLDEHIPSLNDSLRRALNVITLMFNIIYVSLTLLNYFLHIIIISCLLHSLRKILIKLNLYTYINVYSNNYARMCVY